MFKFLTIVAALSASALSHSIRLAPLMEPSHGEIIPGEYIVNLREPEFAASADSSAYVDEHLNRLFGFGVRSNVIIQKYDLGYAAVLDQDQVNHLRSMAEVDFIESNSVVKMYDVQQDPRNWGLDRISHRDLPLQGKYIYSSKAGEGVDVYVVDTGVYIDHVDFGGRAVWGLTAPQGDEDEDGNGHGTHVASTIAGNAYGVAKGANIIAVKVLRSSGYGTMADVIKGVEFTASEHARKTSEGKVVKSVANMSLGGGKSPSLDYAVTRAISKGVLFAVAAGNDNRDACNYSPAGVADAITVGSSDKYDSRSYFSNYGKCVDIFAPGSDITAAWIGYQTALKTISGTSMASPHVAGVMALFTAEGNYTTSELKTMVLKVATDGKVKNSGFGSPNKLLFSNPPTESNESGLMSSIVDSLRFHVQN